MANNYDEWKNNREYTKTNGIDYGQMEKIPPIGLPGPLDKAAYYGFAGKFIALVEPQTESDPIAILVSFLTAFGNLIGEGPFFPIESSNQHPRLYSLIVGDTAKARKGTSFGYVRRLLTNIDPTWDAQFTGGLSSGEGITWSVRDEITKISKAGTKVVVDEGVVDKRRLILEQEFARVLGALTREGSTLSDTLRSAWDHDGRLQILTKNTPAKAEHSHISIICHITEDELLKDLRSVEMFNGFFNRFLVFYSTRSKILSRGGKVDPQQFKLLVGELEEIISKARYVREMDFSETAGVLWDLIYEELTKPQSGVLEKLFTRCEPYVLRIASIYALLDKTGIIEVEHLKAAVALIDYSLESLRYVFGETSGNPDIDKILEFLDEKQSPVTQTEINNLFGRNKSSKELIINLNYLLKKNVISAYSAPTGGRRVTLYSSNSYILTKVKKINHAYFTNLLNGYISEIENLTN